jgi:hypothetical protein
MRHWTSGFHKPWSCCPCSHGLRPKKLSVSVAVPPAPVLVPRHRPHAPSVASVTSVANDKSDNEMILEAVQRSPGICLTAEENLTMELVVSYTVTMETIWKNTGGFVSGKKLLMWIWKMSIWWIGLSFPRMEVIGESFFNTALNFRVHNWRS